MKNFLMAGLCIFAVACGETAAPIVIDAGPDARRDSSTDSGRGYTCEPFRAPTTSTPSCEATTVACLGTARTNEALNACITNMEPQASRQACVTCLNSIEPNCAARAIPTQSERDPVACVFSCLDFRCPTGGDTCLQGALAPCLSETGASQANFEGFVQMCVGGTQNRFAVCQRAGTDGGVDGSTTDAATTDAATTDAATTDTAIATDAGTADAAPAEDAATNG